ncbi:LPXTG cell wall anchor domain-containing protein [Microvirga calopogonii]|uniref:LPXTG cell wall anchor domain-containing protein n=1 Tax=Microvirga calopogonii TaxID=2078013 RepID=UPI00197B7655|nr:LPXTG cell wall anchor domain-containing protein [Microvirga calopogonii]
MAMDPMDREPNVYNRETNVYDNTGRGSNTLAYVIGGLVVALGLLAFLFYDGGSNEPSTTGSTGTQTERSSPSTGSTAPTTPTTPSAPAAPASPSSPAAPSAPANPQ